MNFIYRIVFPFIILLLLLLALLIFVFLQFCHQHFLELRQEPRFLADFITDAIDSLDSLADTLINIS
jgi:hypothetical protein